MKRILLTLAFFLLAPALYAQNVAVTGNTKDMTGNAAVKNTFVRFKLKNYTGSIPKVNGVAVIYPSCAQSNAICQDFAPDNTGLVTGQIYGNDQIDPSGTYYTLEFWFQGRIAYSADYLITGTAFNFNTAIPISNIPPIGPNQVITMAFQCNKPTPATTWTCQHNMNDGTVISEYFDTNGKLLWPDTIVNTDGNTTTATFLTPQAGKALIIHTGSVTLATNQPNAVVQNPSSPQTISGSLNITADTSLPNVSLLQTKNVNNVVYADQQAGSDACAKINTAIGLLPSSGGIVNANGFLSTPQTCASNPFAGFATKPVQLFLCGTITTTAMWTLEESQSVIGCGRDLLNIKGDPTFNYSTNKGILSIGSTGEVDGARYENLRVDCQQAANSVGFYAAFAAEQSGLRNALAINCIGKGIWWDGGLSENSSMDNIEVLVPNGGGAGTIPVFIDASASFRGIHGATINGTGSTGIPVGIRLNNNTSGTFSDIHLEGVTTGIDLAPAAAVAGVLLSDIYGHSSITDLVKVGGFAGSQVVMMNLTKNAGTNAINDVLNGRVFTDNRVPFYSTAAPFYNNGALTNFGKIITQGDEFQSINTAATEDGRIGIDSFGAGQFGIGTLTNHPVKFYSNNNLSLTLDTSQNAKFEKGVSIGGITNATGLQILNTTTTCTTAASVGATCTTAAITLPVTEPDTAYRLVCTGKGLTNVPVVIATTNSSTSQFTITIAALTAAAASFTSYDCTVGHN